MKYFCSTLIHLTEKWVTAPKLSQQFSERSLYQLKPMILRLCWRSECVFELCRLWGGRGGGNSQHNRLHIVSAPLWSANISVPRPTNHCAPSQQQPNKPGRRAQTHPFITERLPVTSSGSYPNQPSTPADNALWNPSPWELLHMLWVVVKATWLNNCPCSSLMRRLASPRLTHSFLWCENNRSERVLRIEGERGRAKCVLMVIILQTASF